MGVSPPQASKNLRFFYRFSTKFEQIPYVISGENPEKKSALPGRYTLHKDSQIKSHPTQGHGYHPPSPPLHTGDSKTLFSTKIFARLRRVRSLIKGGIMGT